LVFSFSGGAGYPDVPGASGISYIVQGLGIPLGYGRATGVAVGI